MKKFLINILKFLLICAACFGILILLMLPSRKKMLTLPADTTIAFLGNSTVELAIDDSLVPGLSNRARSGEGPDMVYAKIKLLKKFNPSLDTIVVGFDDMILDNTTFAAPMSPKCIVLDQFDIDDWLLNLRYYCIDTNEQFLSSLFHSYSVVPLLYPAYNNYSSFGGYQPKDVVMDAQEEAAAKEPAPERVLGDSTFPYLCRHYFDRIVEFCNRNDITLFFFSTPKHHSVRREIDVFKQAHDVYYPDVRLIDFSEMELPDSCYADPVHVNSAGAAIVTRRVTDILR